MRSRTGDPKSAGNKKDLIGPSPLRQLDLTQQASRIAIGLTSIGRLQKGINQLCFRHENVGQRLVLKSRDAVPLQCMRNKRLGLTVCGLLEI